MPKHIYIEGYIYYITAVTYNRLKIFTRPSFIIPLYDSLNFYRYKYNILLLGYVIMPDHIHLILWPQGKGSISDFMRDFKTFTSKRLIRQAELEQINEWIEAFKQAGLKTGCSENKVWQDNFWDKIIYTEKFLRQKLDYIHLNPIRGGLTEDISNYPYSSYRNYEYGDNTLIEIDSNWL